MVSPDVGGVARARELAERIGADLAIVDKRRAGPGEVASMTVIGEVDATGSASSSTTSATPPARW